MSPSSKALLTTPACSRLMQRVGRKDTAPEICVRRYLHAEGFRFRLHLRTLPGSPDLVLARRATVVFVNGCFWHGHHCKHGRVAARSNVDYWQAKIGSNRERDRRNARTLRAMGWHVETVWECECKNEARLNALVRRLAQR